MFPKVLLTVPSHIRRSESPGKRFKYILIPQLSNTTLKFKVRVGLPEHYINMVKSLHGPISIVSLQLTDQKTSLSLILYKNNKLELNYYLFFTSFLCQFQHTDNLSL